MTTEVGIQQTKVGLLLVPVSVNGQGLSTLSSTLAIPRRRFWCHGPWPNSSASQPATRSLMHMPWGLKDAHCTSAGWKLFPSAP